MLILEGEFTESVGQGISVIVSGAHGFGTDALLLASFASCKASDIACDLGTGCGIIPLLWFRDGLFKEIYGVDIQPLACDQFRRSLDMSRISKRINVINADLRDLMNTLNPAAFTLVTMNPPYKPVSTGVMSSSSSDQISRHEVMCTVFDACKAACGLLNYGGRFCMCHRPERLCDVISAMRENNLEPKRLRFVSQNSSLAPWLFLIEGKKGAKPQLQVLPTLYIKDDYGNDSQELIKIFGDYRETK
ncbi:MAG: methyltransferase [Oscillospiraceae bacterium]|jgi:tRNA1(Val) A37 N6-methylase TrmN6|nr:methyltransferase [Oscillospiraceae bacterium]